MRPVWTRAIGALGAFSVGIEESNALIRQVFEAQERLGIEDTLTY